MTVTRLWFLAAARSNVTPPTNTYLRCCCLQQSTILLTTGHWPSKIQNWLFWAGLIRTSRLLHKYP